MGRLRLVPIVVAALLTAAACGAVDDVVDDVVAPPDPGATAGDPAGGEEPGEAPGGTATGPAPAGTASAPPVDTGPSGEHQHAPPPGGFDAVPDGSGPPGSLAPVLLRRRPAERLVVEVLVQPGAEPRAASLDRVQGVLREVSGKPVRLAGPVPVPGDRRDWTADAIRQAADALATERQGDGQAVIRLLFLRGAFAESDRSLGVAVRGDLAAVFVDRIRSTGTPLVGAGPIEEAVTLHEVGHLLGLVDLYHDTGRADPEHPGHSPNPGSVMYWAVQTTLVVDVLGGGPPRDFDADDLADLAAIRAGAGG